MKLIFLPATVTYHFQLALTNPIHGYAAHRVISLAARAAGFDFYILVQDSAVM